MRRKIDKYRACIVFCSFILLLVILMALDNSMFRKFCLSVTPEYILSCNVGNNTLTVLSEPQNLKTALEKNNCSIKGRNDIIDIIYCYQNVSNYTKKYKLFAMECFPKK